MTLASASPQPVPAAEPPLALLDVVGCGIWTYDGENTTFVNRALAEITGYSCEELLTPGFFEHLIHPEDRDMILARGQARVRGEDPPEQYEVRIISKSGEVRHLALDARRLELPGGTVSVVSAMDISALKDAEQTIRDGTTQVIDLLDALPAHVITTTPAGKPTFVNRHWLELTGQTMEAAMDRGTAALIHPEDVERATAEWMAALRSGEGYDIEYRVRERDGDYRWQNFRIRPVRSGDGTLTGWTSASVDVHEAVELRHALQEANERLEEAMRSKDEVLGLISHELRTPLTTLLGNARILKRRAEELAPEDRLAVANDLESDAVRLNSVIQNMLVLSRAATPGEVELEPARLQRLAETAIEEFSARNPGRRVTLGADADLPLVLANPVYYQQVIGNLLGNASKYSPEGGCIEVHLHAEPGVIATSVRDHGAGIPESELSQVFAPFFRSKNHASVYGIGLGLTVCQRLAEIQGGTISVRNCDGGGCEFTFTTPLLGEVEE